MKTLCFGATVLLGSTGTVAAAPLSPTYDFAYAKFAYTYETQVLTGSIDATSLEEDGTVTGGDVSVDHLYIASGQGVVTVTGDVLGRPQVYTISGPADPISSYVYAKDYMGAEPDTEMSGFPEFFSYQGGDPVYGIWGGVIELTARPLDGFGYEIWEAGFTFSGYVSDWAWGPDRSDAQYFGSLAPIPIPASGLLLLAAVGGAAVSRRKRRIELADDS